MATIDDLMNIEPENISTSTQALFCFCLDTSLSMMGKKIKTINECMKKFIKDNSEDVFNSNITNICIVAFGGIEPKVIQEFDNIKNITFKKLEPNGGTHMAAGIELAIKKILDERKKWEERGVTFYKPLLIIMSDGKSDDNLNAMSKREKMLIEDGKLNVSCIGFDIENDAEAKKDLQQVCPNKKIETADSFNMENYFQRLSRSVSNTSRQFAGPIEDF